jgi:hypothetical protein
MTSFQSRPQLSRLCVFCERHAKMTSEHVWGQWLRPYLRRDMNKHHLHRRIVSENGPDHTGVRIRAGGPLARMLPERKQTADPSTPLYLEEPTVGGPAVGLASAARETLHMGDIVEEMLKRACCTRVWRRDVDRHCNIGCAPVFNTPAVGVTRRAASRTSMRRKSPQRYWLSRHWSQGN